MFVPQSIRKVFTFGGAGVSTFDEHKSSFAVKYNGGMDINHNAHPVPPTDGFVFKLGKTVDFHEDVIKQMYLLVQSHESLIAKNFAAVSALESKFELVKQRFDVMVEHVDYLMTEEKRKEDERKNAERLARYDELKAELAELEKLLSDSLYK